VARFSAPALAIAVVLAVAVAVSSPSPASGSSRADEQTTQLISRAMDGGIPNGPSTNAVISDDKRFARVIAFQSQASDLVPGDTNGFEDVFAVKRAGSIANDGAPWAAGRTILISRGLGGQPANGPSFSPAIDGAFHSAPKCVAFLSAASNLVRGDTNGKVDAFVSRGPGGAPQRVSLLPGNKQPVADTSDVALSGDCSRIAFVNGGRLFVRVGKRTRTLKAPGVASAPSFSTGLRNDLVFAAARGVYLSRNGTSKPRLVAPGGSNPAYNDIKRQVVTYQKDIGGHSQVYARDLGHGERLISGHDGTPGNADSTNPVIGNAGYYITFQSGAGNLGTNALARAGDQNDKPDVYLYTDVRHLTLVQSVAEKGIPLFGGGQNPSMSFYANYIVFDSPAPLDSTDGPHQIFMRYLGGV
jgi:hypothetical protein